MIRVLLADDQQIIRSAFAQLVDGQTDMTVVAEAEDGDIAIRSARELRPDVILMDIRMPTIDGIEATKTIASDPKLVDTRVLILTTFDLDQYVYGALEAGASGFLLKDTSPQQLLEAIRVVAAGEALLAPSVTKRLIADFAALPDPNAAPVLADLTEREREVLVEVGHGLSNQDIAARLFISPLTAKTHVSRLRTKLAVRDRAQLVVIAYQTGLVRPQDQARLDDPPSA